MTENEVALKVQDLVAELAPDKQAEISPEARLAEDLGYHSLALLELSVLLEDTFDLPPLDGTAAREIGNVGDITRLVFRTIASGAH